MSYSYRSSRTSTSSRYSRPRNRQRNYNRGKTSRSIDPRRFIAPASVREEEVYVPQHTFDDFAINNLLKDNLAAKGYTVPSPIQDQAIPTALQGKDVIGLAGTGTGKTAAFALPVLQRLIAERNSAALIVAPTRELAQQIEVEFRALSRGSGLTDVLLIGGTGMGTQLNKLRYSPRIVIGTPGRIKDHLKRGTLKLDNFNMVVLDEVDRMLDMGFISDVREIVGRTNNTRQSLFFSATMSSEIRNLIDTFTHDPVTVTIKTVRASENIHQDVVRHQSANKIELLHDLLIKEEVLKTIVFDETQRSVERLNRELLGRGFKTEAIHGGKTQGQRQRALAKFRTNEVSILVATDVAARGIDVVDISHVVNYTPPKEYNDYIHRIGRAGRAGRVGYAFTFVNE